MKREAELLYLRDIRDLEIAKAEIEKRIMNTTDSLNNSKAKYSKKNFKTMPNYKAYVNIPSIGAFITSIISLMLSVLVTNIDVYDDQVSTLVLAVAFSIATIVFAGFAFNEKELEMLSMTRTAFSVIVLIFVTINIDGLPMWGAGCLAFGMLYFFVIYPHSAYCKEEKLVQAHNEAEQKRTHDNEQRLDKIIKNGNSWLSFYNSELKKINSALSFGYSFNIIPSHFRYNLAAIWYIYEWMSTSQSSLRDTLISAKIEEGIRRIEAKLDTIIQQNSRMIAQNRQLEANAQATVKQNEAMLNVLERTERNTEESMYYAREAALYNEVNAFFSTANYLRS